MAYLISQSWHREQFCWRYWDAPWVKISDNYFGPFKCYSQYMAFSHIINPETIFNNNSFKRPFWSYYFCVWIAEADSPSEPASALLWALYFLAQHYDYLGDTGSALEAINAAINHTPTLIELFVTKGRIYKVISYKKKIVVIVNNFLIVCLACGWSYRGLQVDGRSSGTGHGRQIH